MWRKVDPGKVGRFVCGVLVSLLEPLSGGRVLKSSFRDTGTTGGQVFDSAAGEYVDEERDRRVVRAENNLVAARNDRRNGLLVVGVDDLPELVVEVLYLARTDKEALNPADIRLRVTRAALRHARPAQGPAHQEEQEPRCRSPEPHQEGEGGGPELRLR